MAPRKVPMDIKKGSVFTGYETPAQRMVRLISENQIASAPAVRFRPTQTGEAAAGFRRSVEWFKGTHQRAVADAQLFASAHARKRRP